MKLFTPSKDGVGASALARAEAAAGGQALAVYPWRGHWHGQNGPRCFRGASEIGKLYDQDPERLGGHGARLRRATGRH